MRILMLSDVYFPRVNGVSTSIRTYARYLSSRGHEVVLVAPDYGMASEVEPFEVVRLPARTIFFDPEDRLIREGALRGAYRELQSRRFDVIHIHTPFQAHRLGVRLGRATGTPTVETYHTYFEQYVAHYLPWLPPALSRWSARALSRSLCSAVDHLIVPSAQMVDVLGRYGIASPTTVIPTGVDTALFANGSGSRFRSRHGIASDRPTLVTVSRLAREKNIDFLLDVVRRLVPGFPDLLFIIAGEGPDAPRLQARVRELGLDANVQFFGNLDRESALLDCYRAGDVFVFASPTETQGLVLIEAMALGVPIVSTAVMGTASVLAGATSARVSAENVTAFADAVSELLRSPAMRRALADAGPRDAERWSVASLMARAENLYLELAAQP